MRIATPRQPHVSPKALFERIGASSSEGWIALRPIAVPHLCQAVGDSLLWADINLAQYGPKVTGQAAAEVVAWTPETTVRLGRRELDKFVNIKSTAGAGRLARLWGPLRFCDQHGLPGSHAMTGTAAQTLLVAGSKRPPLCPHIGHGDVRVLREAKRAHPSGRVVRYGKEPLTYWVRMAAEFHALLSLAARLRLGGEDMDLTQLNPLWKAVTFGIEDPWTTRTAWPDGDRGKLAIQVDRWLLWGGVRLHSVVSRDEIRPAIASTGLAGALATLLFAAICGGKALTLCSECAVPFIADRVPASSRSTYCRDCGPKAISKASSRRYDARHRGRSHKPRQTTTDTE